MNRPKREDYKINDWEYSGQYVLDLEKYCDEVELERGYFKMHADIFLESLKKQEKEIEKLKKALDKATRYLTYDHFTIANEFAVKEMMYWKTDDWKEFLLEDE